MKLSSIFETRLWPDMPPGLKKRVTELERKRGLHYLGREPGTGDEYYGPSEDGKLATHVFRETGDFARLDEPHIWSTTVLPNGGIQFNWKPESEVESKDSVTVAKPKPPQDLGDEKDLPDEGEPEVDQPKPTEKDAAAKQAERLGLKYLGFGRYGKQGKVTHNVKDGKLVPKLKVS